MSDSHHRRIVRVIVGGKAHLGQLARPRLVPMVARTKRLEQRNAAMHILITSGVSTEGKRCQQH